MDEEGVCVRGLFTFSPWLIFTDSCGSALPLPRFQVDLQLGNSLKPRADVAFHFNPRFKRSNCIVCNTLTNEKWGWEEITYDMPFRKEKSFEIVIMVLKNKFQVGSGREGSVRVSELGASLRLLEAVDPSFSVQMETQVQNRYSLILGGLSSGLTQHRGIIRRVDYKTPYLNCGKINMNRLWVTRVHPKGAGPVSQPDTAIGPWGPCELSH